MLFEFTGRTQIMMEKWLALPRRSAQTCKGFFTDLTGLQYVLKHFIGSDDFNYSETTQMDMYGYDEISMST